MNVKASDIPKQQQFFTEYWNLYKKYYELWKEDDSERQWDMLQSEVELIAQAYKETDFYDFVRGMLLQIVLEFERKSEFERKAI